VPTINNFKYTAKRKEFMMTKQELLKHIHEIIWRHDDIMEQDTLLELQDLIDSEIIGETKKETMKIEQLNNGFINDIKILLN